MTINTNDELAEDYLAEAHDHLAAFETDLLTMEKGGAEVDKELMNRLFRAVRSVKAGASFFDLSKVGELARQTEHALVPIRSGAIVPTSGHVRVLLSAIDKLRELIQNPAASNQADISAVVAALTSLHANDAAGPESRNLRVLLVEDDFACRLLLQTFLARYGECHVAVNGREAVAAFRSALERALPYNLICMDIMMPEMDGREAVRQIRALEESRGIFSTSGATIVMTTALDEIGEIVLCFKELCDAYLIKPIDLAKLLGHMKACQLIQ